MAGLEPATRTTHFDLVAEDGFEPSTSNVMSVASYLCSTLQ